MPKHVALTFFNFLYSSVQAWFSHSVNSEKEEDMLLQIATLQKLEALRARAQARLEREEAAERKAGTDRKYRPPKPNPPSSSSPAARPLDNHISSLWDGVVDKDDQLKLAAHGIKSLEELQEAYQEAEADLNRPPYPSVERLKPRLRLAWQLYHSIPQKLAMKPQKPGI